MYNFRVPKYVYNVQNMIDGFFDDWQGGRIVSRPRVTKSFRIFKGI